MTYVLPEKYLRMNEAAVQAALADKHDSQIIQELACLMEKYARDVRKALGEGKSPETLLKPQACALEDMALRMVVDAARSGASKKV